jgi:hypothetical protein
LYDSLLVEPEAAIGAGELAMHCLVKAHRLGTGWCVFWPAFPRSAQGTWTSKEVERARQPDCLHELTGFFTDDALGHSLIAGLQSASFRVVVR